MHRTERGLLPACVEACGIHAMTLVDYDNPTPETAKLIEAARPMNEAAGTHPKIRYIARHMDAAKMAVKLTTGPKGPRPSWEGRGPSFFPPIVLRLVLRFVLPPRPPEGGKKEKAFSECDAGDGGEGRLSIIA